MNTCNQKLAFDLIEEDRSQSSCEPCLTVQRADLSFPPTNALATTKLREEPLPPRQVSRDRTPNAPGRTCTRDGMRVDADSSATLTLISAAKAFAVNRCGHLDTKRSYTGVDQFNGKL